MARNSPEHPHHSGQTGFDHPRTVRPERSGPPPFIGRSAEVTTQGGCKITLSDFVTQADWASERHGTAMLQLCVMLDGAGTSWLEHRPAPISFRPNWSSLLYSKRPVSGRFIIPKGTHIALVDLRFDVSRRGHLFPKLREAVTGGQFEVVSDTVPDVWLAQFETPRTLQSVALEMMAKETAGTSEELWLEAKAIEALSLVTALLDRKKPDNPAHNSALSLKDRNQVKLAYDILTSDLEHDWTIRKLSRQVGLNENKLKRGFNSVIGNSVYSCLQEKRMIAAAQKIRLGSESITEIALSVGYSSPAHFARIFKRYYGETPRDFRNRH